MSRAGGTLAHKPVRLQGPVAPYDEHPLLLGMWAGLLLTVVCSALFLSHRLEEFVSNRRSSFISIRTILLRLVLCMVMGCAVLRGFFLPSYSDSHPMTWLVLLLVTTCIAIFVTSLINVLYRRSAFFTTRRATGLRLALWSVQCLVVLRVIYFCKMTQLLPDVPVMLEALLRCAPYSASFCSHTLLIVLSWGSGSLRGLSPRHALRSCSRRLSLYLLALGNVVISGAMYALFVAALGSTGHDRLLLARDGSLLHAGAYCMLCLLHCDVHVAVARGAARRRQSRFTQAIFIGQEQLLAGDISEWLSGISALSAVCLLVQAVLTLLAFFSHSLFDRYFTPFQLSFFAAELLPLLPLPLSPLHDAIEDGRRRNSLRAQLARIQRRRARLNAMRASDFPTETDYIDALVDRHFSADAPVTEPVQLRGVTTCEGTIEDVCSICLEHIQRGDAMVKLSCSHHFHADCLQQWLPHKASCPLCKAPARDKLQPSHDGGAHGIAWPGFGDPWWVELVDGMRWRL